MPNWVTTEIKIRGKAEDLAAFVKKHIVTHKYDDGSSEDKLDFDTVIPSPKTVEECPAEYVMMDAEEAKERHLGWDDNDPTNWFDWYHWNINNWGTKWNASNTSYPEADSILAQGSTEIAIWLDTAWSPATPVYYKLQEMYPDLDIEVFYGDEGGFFVGHLKADGADIVFNGDYSRPEPKAICDEIGMEYLYRGPDDDEDDEEEGGVC
jgi:hypothetical protein